MSTDSGSSRWLALVCAAEADAKLWYMSSECALSSLLVSLSRLLSFGAFDCGPTAVCMSANEVISPIPAMTSAGVTG